MLERVDELEIDLFPFKTCVQNRENLRFCASLGSFQVICAFPDGYQTPSDCVMRKETFRTTEMSSEFGNTNLAQKWLLALGRIQIWSISRAPIEEKNEISRGKVLIPIDLAGIYSSSNTRGEIPL